MSVLLVSRPAPEFSTQALVGRDFRTIALEDYRGTGVLLAFYPLDFTFVCPTELVALNERHAAFVERSVQVLACSVDSVYSHLGWVTAEPSLSALAYPLLSDITKQISRSYQVLLEDAGIALRGTFLIDPRGLLRWASVNDLQVGRSVDEILRVIDAVQSDKLCPCDWKKGQKTLS